MSERLTAIVKSVTNYLGGISIAKRDGSWYIILDRKKVYNYVRVFLVIVFLLLAIFIIWRTRNSRQYTDGSIGTWLSHFKNGEYDQCDSMTVSSKDRLLVVQDKPLLGSHKASVEMYKALLGACAESIEKVEVVNGSNGEYTVETTFATVNKVNKVKIDYKKYDSLIDKYIDGSLNVKSFKKRLSVLYLDSFKKTVCTKGGRKKKKFRFTLKEPNPDKVSGVYTYVYTLLKKMGYLRNVKYYEESVDSAFSSYLESKY